ncbi:MAG TPA: 3-phosphoshikimate 1-carboxyvinyltransferase [Gemmatimonadetes bacterium]|nr:3-phosphoshikimate 1-carboxyvinyltransferase [Gemmatimonadota bacterium]HIN51601.1 3-phosphoshikimate 1-carboxyvinyltransferase [Gemmatimonadota bacterium]
MRVHVPGDKSLTQRALILSALAEGESRISGLLFGGDAESTANALRALGAGIPQIPSDGSEITVQGVGLGGLRSPGSQLDLGNSGTGARLLLGVLSGSAVETTITGDESLRSRPMRRVTEPLSAMGARFDFLAEDGLLPIRLRGKRPLQEIDWSTPVASAQVKSSILLAGLTGGASALITEPEQSRDHTERIFRQVGVSTESRAVADGWRVEMHNPPNRISELDFRVPGDVSSAAFLLASAVLGGTAASLDIVGVGLNPTRTAFLDVLERMGAEITVETDADDENLEAKGTVSASLSSLTGTHVGAAEVPRMIDELPLVAVLGARAQGETSIRGAQELRAKESDRIDAVVRNLRVLGVDVEEHEDGLIVLGSDRPLKGRVEAFDDHRIAMAFGVLGAAPGNDIEVDDPHASGVSFPGFWELLRELGAGSHA